MLCFFIEKLTSFHFPLWTLFCSNKHTQSETKKQNQPNATDNLVLILAPNNPPISCTQHQSFTFCSVLLHFYTVKVCISKLQQRGVNDQTTSLSVTQLLERISEVVEQNRLFTSDRPGLGQELETLQKHLESLSATPLPPDYNFSSNQGLTNALSGVL